jgi:hypothetical protein
MWTPAAYLRPMGTQVQLTEAFRDFPQSFDADSMIGPRV